MQVLVLSSISEVHGSGPHLKYFDSLGLADGGICASTLSAFSIKFRPAAFVQMLVFHQLKWLMLHRSYVRRKHAIELSLFTYGEPELSYDVLGQLRCQGNRICVSRLG